MLTYHLQILRVTNLLFIEELSPYRLGQNSRLQPGRWHVGIKSHEKKKKKKTKKNIKG